MRRASSITFCALASAVGFAALPATAEEREEAATRAEEELWTGKAVAGEAAQAGPAGQATASGRVWWNSPTMVEELSLSGKQRVEMDGYLAAFRQKTRENGAQGGVRFNDALNGRRQAHIVICFARSGEAGETRGAERRAHSPAGMISQRLPQN